MACTLANRIETTSRIQHVANYNRGLTGELNAIKLLEKQNISIVGHRIKNKYGEIDILAKKADVYYIIEVKSRKNFAREAINRRQLGRSFNAFLQYANEQQIAYDYIGVKAIVGDGVNMEIIDIDDLEMIEH